MRIRSIGLIVLFALELLAAPLLAEAQQAGTIVRIGFLVRVQPSPRYERFLAAFRQDMREHGYLEGQHYVIDYRWMGAQREHNATVVGELVRLPVDVILASGARNALIAKRVTTTVPIVVAIAINPVAHGLVESLARPGGNVTGMVYPAGVTLSGKRLELLREITPQLSSVALVWDANNPVIVPLRAALEVAAKTLGVTLHLVNIHSPDDVDTALATLVRERVEGLFVGSTTEVMAERRRLIAFADQQRLPALWTSARAVRDGALMSYAANYLDMYRRAATYVVKILQGTKPADLPMERADRIDLTINLQTAQRRGLTIPPTVLFQATELIR